LRPNTYYKAASMNDEKKRAPGTRHYVLTLTGSQETRKRLLGGKGDVVEFFRTRGADSVSVKPDFGGLRNPLVEVRLNTEEAVVDRIVASLNRRAGRYRVPFRVIVEEGPGTKNDQNP